MNLHLFLLLPSGALCALCACPPIFNALCTCPLILFLPLLLSFLPPLILHPDLSFSPSNSFLLFISSLLSFFPLPVLSFLLYSSFFTYLLSLFSHTSFFVSSPFLPHLTFCISLCKCLWWYQSADGVLCPGI